MGDVMVGYHLGDLDTPSLCTYQTDQLHMQVKCCSYFYFKYKYMLQIILLNFCSECRTFTCISTN